jgi:hypothetical protein
MAIPKRAVCHASRHFEAPICLIEVSKINTGSHNLQIISCSHRKTADNQLDGLQVEVADDSSGLSPAMLGM